MSKPTISVLQAFSKQGKSVILSLVKEGKYHVKGLTSRPIDTNPDAKQLIDLGVELVQGDVNKKEDLVSFFKGSYGVFLVKPPISVPELPQFTEKEVASITLQADAANEAGVKHVVYSSVDETGSPAPADGEVCKTKLQRYIEGLPFQYVSTLFLSYFYSNVIEYSRPLPQEDGSFVFATPIDKDTAMPYVDAYTTTGPIVAAFFAEPEKYNRVGVPVVTEYITGPQLAEKFQRVTGIKASHRFQTQQDFLVDMHLNASPELQYIGNLLYNTFVNSVTKPYVTKYLDLSVSKQIYPNQITFEQFLQTTGWKGESYQDWKQKNGY
eukprot:gene3945-4927_t